MLATDVNQNKLCLVVVLKPLLNMIGCSSTSKATEMLQRTEILCWNILWKHENGKNLTLYHKLTCVQDQHRKIFRAHQNQPSIVAYVNISLTKMTKTNSFCGYGSKDGQDCS
jgi:hypothetical protein